MEGQITLNEWMEWKEDIRRKLQETAQNFVYIGYRLKQIKESGMLDGCSDIFEFAQKEYGLERTTVWRFMAINEKFSEGGNSLYLKDEYRNFGSSKLTEMLNLSDVDCRLIVEKTTVKEIREIKQFNQRGALAQSGAVPEEICSNAVRNCIIDFFADGSRRKILNEVLRVLCDEEPAPDTLKKLAEFINPGEYTTHKKGIVYMFFYDYQTGIKYKLMTEPAPKIMKWDEFILSLIDIYKDYVDLPGGVWEAYYGVPETVEEKVTHIQENQGKTAVATSQQNETKNHKNETKKTESKSVKTTKITPKEDVVEEIVEEVQKETTETVPEEVEILDNPEWELIKSAREIVESFKDIFSDNSICVKSLEYVKSKADELKLIATQLIELKEEKEDENR